MNLTSVNPLDMNPPSTGRLLTPIIIVSGLIHTLLLGWLITQPLSFGGAAPANITTLDIVSLQMQETQHQPVSETSEEAISQPPSAEAKELAEPTKPIAQPTIQNPAIATIQSDDFINVAADPQTMVEHSPPTPTESAPIEATPSTSAPKPATPTLLDDNLADNDEAQEQKPSSNASKELVEQASSITPDLTAFTSATFNGPVPSAETPPQAKRKRQFGRVVVRGYINEAGQLENETVFLTSGYSILDQAALQQAKQWSYSPAYVGLVPVGYWVEIPIEFR